MSAAQFIDPLSALVRLWRLAQADHGGANVAAKLLLGMYNGTRFPFDVTNLRRLDQSNLDDALTVLRMDAACQHEVHDWLNRLFERRDMGERFEHMAHRWKLKGRCKKEFLCPLAPWNTSSRTPAAATHSTTERTAP